MRFGESVQQEQGRATAAHPSEKRNAIDPESLRGELIERKGRVAHESTDTRQRVLQPEGAYFQDFAVAVSTGATSIVVVVHSFTSMPVVLFVPRAISLDVLAVVVFAKLYDGTDDGQTHGRGSRVV